MSRFYTNVALIRGDILLRGYEHGKRIQRAIPYKPYLFVPTPKETIYQTLEGKPVGRVDFDSVKEARDFLQTYKDVDGMTIYGLNNFVYPFIYDNYQGEINYDPSVIRVTSIDIEVDIAGSQGFPDIQEASNAVTLITLSHRGLMTVLGCGEFKTDRKDVRYIKCKDEIELLTRFIDVWNSDQYSPDIITGWNVEFFDIPYLVNRIKRVLGEGMAKKLSPWKMLQENTVEIRGNPNQVFVPLGITILDYMQLYRKFAYTIQESYSLDHIAFQELGERKLDYGEYGSLAELQVRNFQMYTEYNIRDVELVDKLDDKLKLIELVFAMAYDAKVNYQDTFTTVRAWDVIIHNYLMDKNIVVHQISVPDQDRGILGGYVKDPQVGMHKWVVSLDLNSLYPHIIMQYNISPETFRGWMPGVPECAIKEMAEDRVLAILNGFLDQPACREHLLTSDVTCTANLITFDRKQEGFLPALMRKYYDERVIYKNKMIEAKKLYEGAPKGSAEREQLNKDISKFNNLQMAKKIQLNSAYGALGNRFFRWNRGEFAEAITSSGQLTTRWIERKLNQYLNKTFKTEDVDYVIACDTDSVYIKADKFMELSGKAMTKEQEVAYLDKICVKVLEPYIDKCYAELCTLVNGFDQKMKMKRECIADKGIWTAKKRYILNVWNQEGVAYEKPKLKMMGIEAIRTSTPQVCRDGIKNALTVIMNQEETALHDFVKNFRLEFGSLSFEQVASPRSVKDLDKYRDASQIYKKGTPINVKGALIYNYYLKHFKIDKKYEAIASGQKIKYAYCKTPNPLQCTVISCPSELPKEFNMDKYIDRDTQFEKAFLEPIKTITEAIGWEVEPRATLESFFV